MRRPTPRLAAACAPALATALSLTACGSGFSSRPGNTGSGQLTSSKAALSILIGSSGDAETNAMTAAAKAWSKTSGIGANVQVANNLDQQLAQGFAEGKPADVFYVSTSSLTGYASNGSLLAYGDQLPDKNDFYPTLRDSFTFGGKFYCAPKDLSTLALFINTADWQATGLTDADIPTTWDQLATVAKKLTAPGHAGLTMSPRYERVGAFMAQAGGSLTLYSGDADVSRPTPYPAACRPQAWSAAAAIPVWAAPS
jgi:multiple sugar transport system substrate-binding protein